MDFAALLARFSATVEAHDSAGFAALFSDDGRYDDYFWGSHHGRAEIAAMLDRFHVGGELFAWEFTDPVFADGLGYATYCFSYRSREPESSLCVAFIARCMPSVRAIRRSSTPLIAGRLAAARICSE